MDRKPYATTLLDAAIASVRIEDNVEYSRFELWVGCELAGILGYQSDEDLPDGRHLDGSAHAFMHTVVKEEFGDHGWAAVLVRASLNTARDRNWRVVPVCTYVQRYLGTHTEFLDLVA